MKMLKYAGLVLFVAVFWITLSKSGLVFALSPGSIDLKTADSFVILAGSAITDSNPSEITGNVGLSPAAGTFMTKFSSSTVAGTIYSVDTTGPAGSVEDADLLTIAKNDLTAAYIAAASTTPFTTLSSPQLGGLTFTPGTYFSASGLNITGTTTLDALGDSNAVFIFQAESTTLTTADSSHVNLINGAQACNVFWQIGSSATLGTNSNFKGNILALDSITDTGSSTIMGRFLARNAAVTLNNTNIARPVCTSKNSLRIIKNVVGGSLSASDFRIHVEDPNNNNTDLDVFGNPVTEGTSTPGASGAGTAYLNLSGTYIVSEEANSAYTQSFSADCLDGNVTITGADKTCTITNTAIPPIFSGGSLPVPVTPKIGITKTVSPLALTTGSGNVVYNYTVWNVSRQRALVNVTVVDDKCGPVTYLSGDLNKNFKIEDSESWVYTCTSYLTKTTTNTAIATGYSDDIYHQMTKATATVTVIVSAPSSTSTASTTPSTAPATNPAPSTNPTPSTIIIPKLPNTGLPPQNTPWYIITFHELLAFAKDLM